MDSCQLLEQYKIFILKAKQDFVLVHEVMGNNNVAPEIMLFHIQQGVEKLIKAKSETSSFFSGVSGWELPTCRVPPAPSGPDRKV